MTLGKRLLVVALAIAVVASVGGCGQDTPTLSWLDGPTAGPSATEATDSVDLAFLPGEAATPTAGPDLGETWTTEPDPETLIALADGTVVAPDQYLIMLDPSATQAAAEKVAATIDGTIGGHLAYVGIWKVLVWPNYHDAIILDRATTLAEQPGVLAAAPVGLVTVDAGPDCAPALADPVYSGANSSPYDMIGVKAAWQAFYASGLPVNTVHVGFQDTLLTRDPRGRVAWEFDDVTFVGDPQTTPDPRPVTAMDPRTDGFHHADGTLGILAGDGQNGGIAGIGSPLGSRLMISQEVLNGPASPGAPSKWTAGDGSTYTDDALLKTIHQIESGATIISGSWGGKSPGDATMWKAFFDRMAVDHPNVLFVFSAGNDQLALDSTTHYPGGIPAPNVISVGSENTDGGRTSYSNGLTTGSTGEVTLGAPGHQAVWGTGADGKVRSLNGGTSSAAPMVSATAALIRSIDPTLSAVEIKAMIAGSAATGDPEVGGKSLRVDLAVRKAIDGARARLGMQPLTDAQIAAATEYCQIDVTGSLKERLAEPAGSSHWDIKASIAESVRPGRMVELTLVEDGLRPANSSQAVTSGGSPARWTILVSSKGAWIIVTRHDNGYWLKYAVRDEVTATPTPEQSETPEATPATDADADADADAGFRLRLLQPPGEGHDRVSEVVAALQADRQLGRAMELGPARPGPGFRAAGRKPSALRGTIRAAAAAP